MESCSPCSFRFLYLQTFILLQRGTPASQAVQGSLNTQPYIIVFENDEFSQFFIAVESTMILESQTLLTEMFNLLATFYVFNLDYPAKGRDFLLFLQEKICNLPTEGKLKRGANAVLINNGINRCFKEIMSDQYQESS